MRVTSQKELKAWLDGLTGKFKLLGPKMTGGKVLYREVTTSSEIVFKFAKADLPAKEHFLPPTHAILSVKRGEEGIELEEPRLEEDRVLFGLRPCDAKALRVLDALFLREPVDPYYAERRERTILVGLACSEMGEECFCTSLGSAPDDKADLDLLLTEVEGGYAVQVVTEKGEGILEGLPLREVEGEPPPPRVREEKVPIPTPEELTQRFDHPFWARLADRCLSCRLCTYLCPTCRCFDVRDYETEGGKIKRLRAWDSCLSEAYRRIAGGHNPRPTKAQRLRNRIYCKFCYYPKDFGPVACVGCGRCIASCPVNVDLVEVLEEVAGL